MVFLNKNTNINPRIYAFSENRPDLQGLIKIGMTNGSVEERVKAQFGTIKPGKRGYKILLDESAISNDGNSFRDTDIHNYLRLQNFANPAGEWFRCKINDVKTAINVIRDGGLSVQGRPFDFDMRPEQREAVRKTAQYFKSQIDQEDNITSHFLWNAKMRFGKTFTAYQLALEMGWKKVLVLTFKPAVQNAWEEDLRTHKDFVDWQFISNNGLNYEESDKTKPMVCFGSFQDFLGKNSSGGIKPKNEWCHTINWDCVILDEYHYGAWRESAKELFNEEERNEKKSQEGEALDYFEEDIMPITTNHYLYLSGTPFRAIESGEFIEDQIYNWTYADEQKAKNDWKSKNNPYSALPKMNLITYELPDTIKDIALTGEYDEFDLNEFFSAKGEGRGSSFVHENEVQKWLNFIRGQSLDRPKDALKLGTKAPPLPFSNINLLSVLNHTFWFLPSISSCYAMRNLINKSHNTFYHDYKIIVAAGTKAGIGVKALDPVKRAMDNPITSKTITLSCGKLTTGVTVKPWTGIFMLRNLTSPESYFQAAFRVQSPWEIHNPDGISPNSKEIIKHECYIFDFAPNRALRQIAEYSSKLNINESNPEKKIDEFIKFLPVYAYDGISMNLMNPSEILDLVMSGVTGTLLARRWESTLLVNVDNSTLSRLMKNDQAMEALMSIEGFRKLNQDLETIISTSDSIKDLKTKANENELSETDKKRLTEEEKQYKNMRKFIQEKLIKLATRIPIFMYLTDYREYSLRDVISQLEPGLFQKVTGLSLQDFELLLSLNVFNASLMNVAVHQFKRYEDSSLVYTGINMHEGEDVGLWETTITAKEFYNQ